MNFVAIGVIFSLILFLTCCTIAEDRKKTGTFLGVTLATTIFLGCVAWVFLSIFFEGKLGGGWAVFIYGIIIVFYLPGVASFAALFLIGKPVRDENPYHDAKDHSPRID